MSEPDLDWEMSVEDVRRNIEEGGDVLLLDVREPVERDIAHIADSLHVPMGDVPGRLPELLAHADRTVVTYCHKGVRSLSVAAFLRENGFDDVRSLAGGIDAWARQVEPDMPTY